MIGERHHMACTRAIGIVGAALAAGLAVFSAAAQEAALPAPQGEVVLRIAGAISRTNAGAEAHFDREMIVALPPAVLETTTAVTDGVNVFEGVLMRDLLAAAGAEGEVVLATALNEYAIDIPMEDFELYDVVAALYMDGEQLLPRDKGPIWIVYPRDDFDVLQDIRYDYRWVWQLERLEVR